MRKTNRTIGALPQGASAAAAAPGRPGLTVLHVDDDPNDAALLSAAANRAGVGFLVQNVHDAEQAIAYLSGAGKYADRHRFPLPSLILLDLKMPRADGFEVLKWIRNSPALRSTQVLVLSGSELQEDIRHAYASGANSYFVKPIGFEALVSLMRNINTFWLRGGRPAPLAGPPAPGAGPPGTSLTA